MPLYEYVCEKCDTRFERLRPLSAIGDPANCPEGHTGGRRVVSVFAALTKDSSGETKVLSGSGCGGCSGGCTNCACGLN